jgi:hypothetical protein
MSTLGVILSLRSVSIWNYIRVNMETGLMRIFRMEMASSKERRREYIAIGPPSVQR